MNCIKKLKLLLVLISLAMAATNVHGSEALVPAPLQAVDSQSLFGAIDSGDIDELQRLLTCGVNPRIRNRLGDTPLHLAALFSNQNTIEMVQALLGAGAKVNATDDLGRTPLHLAAEKDRVEVVRVLLDAGAEVRATDRGGRTPLHLAAEKDNIEFIKAWLGRGRTDNLGQPPLIWVINNGVNITQNIRALLKAGAKVDVTDKGGRTPLQLATEKGDVGAVKELLKVGAEGEVVGCNVGWPPLMYAAIHGYVEIARLLLENGANSEGVDNTGLTPLMCAAAHGHVKIAQLLLENGANSEGMDDMNRTPLLWASEKGRVGVVRELLLGGAVFPTVEAMANARLSQAARDLLEANKKYYYQHRVAVEKALDQMVANLKSDNQISLAQNTVKDTVFNLLGHPRMSEQEQQELAQLMQEAEE